MKFVFNSNNIYFFNFIFVDRVSNLLSVDEVLVYLIPIGAFLMSLNLVMTYWFNRKKRYKVITLSRVFFGFLKFGFIGLIISNLLGVVFLILNFVKSIFRLDSKEIKQFKFNRESFLSLANEYNYFPKYATPSGLVDTFSTIGLPILIVMFYDTKVSGLYFFFNEACKDTI